MPRSILPAAVFFAAALSASTPEDYFSAIRANNIDQIRKLAADTPNVPDSRGTTPLHYAAAYGSTEAVRLLLNAGADVSARNSFDATPLILGAASPEKIKLLLSKGADPKARTKAGRTALIIAAGRAGALPAVQALLDAGADIHAADQLGMTAINAAALHGDLSTVQLLLSRGAKPDEADKAGFTPLINAAATGEIERLRLFLSKGADVNASNVFGGEVKHGPIALTKLTPLLIVSSFASVDVVRVLLGAGAKVNAQDGRGMTPLMSAVSSENQDPRVIKALIAAGADVNAKDSAGETVLDWARKFAHPSTIALLENAGAKGSPIPKAPMRAAAPTEVRQAVEQASALLHRASSEFFKQSGCVGCHHQPATARADAALLRVGVAVPESAKQEQLRAMTATRPVEPALLQFMDPGGEVDTVATALIGFAAAGIPASPLTDAGVSYIAGKQHSDGSWTFQGVTRVPMEDSDITRTASAIKALKTYGWPARQPEFEARVARARAWLLRAEPRTSYERAELLLGLYWSGAPEADLGRIATALLRDQRADGGWAQNRYLPSDAYATGLALHALHETGQLRAIDTAHRKGVAFLLKTQMEDGSWYVRSRSPKFQPYFQSGFPHDHDQWISSAATAYAVMALAPSLETAAHRKYPSLDRNSAALRKASK